ncbi:MAG: hypothetical protein R2851_24865 [Caldilineaceae bacterium]
MTHEEVGVAAALPDQVGDPHGLFHRVRIGVHEDGAVVEALGRVHEDVGHVPAMQFAFILLHLQPLVIAAVLGMHLAKRLHGEVEDQFEVGHAPGDRATFQRGDESFARGHEYAPGALL